MAEPAEFKNAKLKRRGAKAALTRHGKALKILIEGKRPVEEVKELLKKIQQSFEDLEEKHAEFAQMIEDDDEFEREEQWLEECQHIFLDLTHLSTDYVVEDAREDADSDSSSITYEVINVQENDETNTTDSKRFCVTYQDSTKLIKVETLSYEEVKEKIIDKFQVVGPFSLSVKLHEFEHYIDVDENDDIAILKDAKHIVVCKQSPDCGVASTSRQSSYANSAVQTDDESKASFPVDESKASVPVPQCHMTHSHQNTNMRNDLGFDVQAIVNDHPQGKIITEQYEQNKTLSPASRMLLVNIVTANVIERYTFYPSSETKTMAAEAIIRAFPNLKNPMTKLGYEHFFSNADGQSGYIHEKLKNMRRSLPNRHKNQKKGGIKRPSQQPKHFSNGQKKKCYNNECLPDDEENDLILFCHNASIDNNEEIMTAMAKMCPNRQKWLHEMCPCVRDVIQRYPRFKDIPALIDQEFKILYGEAESNLLISKWDTAFVPGILKMGNLSRNTKVQGLMHSLSNSCITEDDKLSLNKKSMYAFNMLINMLPSIIPRYRCSSRDLANHFIVFKPVGTHVEHYLQTQCRIQREPFLLCLGTIDDPEEFFVILDSNAIPCFPNVTFAVDRLFKLHYILNLQCAKELQLFYTFLEYCIYKISLPGNKLPAKLSELIANLVALNIEI